MLTKPYETKDYYPNLDWRREHDIKPKPDSIQVKVRQDFMEWVRRVRQVLAIRGTWVHPDYLKLKYTLYYYNQGVEPESYAETSIQTSRFRTQVSSSLTNV